MCETQPLRSSPALPTPWSQRPPAPNFLPQLVWVSSCCFFGGGLWEHLCGEGLCYRLAVSSSISTFERLNDAPNAFR